MTSAHRTLPSPDHVVLGTSDLDAQVAWWTALGFVATTRTDIDAGAAHALYGTTGTSGEVVMRVPGAPIGSVRLVQTAEPKPLVGHWDRGPHAIDLYTTNMDRSLEIARAAGARVAGRMVYDFGPMRLEEGKSVGPDGTIVVFISNSKRRPSVLDHDPSRIHSEVHSIVNIVASVDAARTSWVDGGGLTLLGDAVIDSPGLADLMELPKVVPARMGLFCDAEVNPIRFEALEFIGLPKGAGTDIVQWPLRPGLPMACFVVDALEQIIATLTDAGFSFGTTAALGDGRLATTGADPSGLRFELRTR